jgi:uncharacterized small protein (DUF1192 family)
MLDDDPFASPKKALPLEAQLETASVGELEDRIARLKDEIAQCERAIAAKKAQRAAADSVFVARPS